GRDLLHGGEGADLFLFASAAESTSVNFDNLAGFNPAGGDRIDLPGTVSAMNPAVQGGSLSQGSFDADLSAALGVDQLSAGNAVLFTASSGDMAGRLFLIADGNGQAGYQAGADFVFELTSPPPLTDINASLFI
ncbi:MAG: hypothetical protein AVDCRST_MAG91-1567, partial [uncultured Sphingomonadaceae bacterium]